ncbi:hypothetical protein ACM66B_004440 [Microbotryomycetes sp. NB124-2]
MAASSPGGVGGPSSAQLSEQRCHSFGRDATSNSSNLTLDNVLTKIKSRETVHAQIYDRLSSRLQELDDKLDEVTRLRRASDPQSPKMPMMTKVRCPDNTAVPAMYAVSDSFSPQLHSAPAFVNQGTAPTSDHVRPPTPLSSTGRRNTAPALIPTSASLDVPPLMADHDPRDRDSTAGSSTSSSVASPMSEYTDVLPFVLDPHVFSAKNEFAIKPKDACEALAVDAVKEGVVRA